MSSRILQLPSGKHEQNHNSQFSWICMNQWIQCTKRQWVWKVLLPKIITKIKMKTIHKNKAETKERLGYKPTEDPVATKSLCWVLVQDQFLGPAFIVIAAWKIQHATFTSSTSGFSPANLHSSINPSYTAGLIRI